MRCRALAFVVVVATVAQAQPAPRADRPVPFSSATAPAGLPERWSPLVFRDVSASRYALVRDEGVVVLRADAQSSASGLAFRFDPPLDPAQVIRWRWKAERLPERGDTRRRDTDDAVARVYVTFEWPPERLHPVQRLRDATIRAIYGETPPHATLLYVWDAQAPAGTTFVNPYTDRVRNIVVESGASRVGQWLAYERDVAADFRRAFGEEPPPIHGVAVMTDADNTRSRATAAYGDVTLEKR